MSNLLSNYIQFEDIYNTEAIALYASGFCKFNKTCKLAKYTMYQQLGNLSEHAQNDSVNAWKLRDLSGIFKNHVINMDCEATLAFSLG